MRVKCLTGSGGIRVEHGHCAGQPMHQISLVFEVLFVQVTHLCIHMNICTHTHAHSLTNKNTHSVLPIYNDDLPPVLPFSTTHPPRLSPHCPTCTCFPSPVPHVPLTCPHLSPHLSLSPIPSHSRPGLGECPMMSEYVQMIPEDSVEWCSTGQ